MTLAMDAPGAAALAIVESLLLALSDRNVLPEREILGILTDMLPAHIRRCLKRTTIPVITPLLWC